MDPVPAPSVVQFESNARCDLRWWLMLVVAIAFTWGGFTIDPLSNCNESGECAPILVPIAAGMGVLALVTALGFLCANPSRGSRLDLASGELVWWKERTARHAGDHGRINAARISRIRIQRESEGADSVHVYDLSGERIAFLDEEVIPWRQEDWAAELVAAWPHITLEIRD